MAQRHSLTISLSERCAIDAGFWQECVGEDQTPYRLVSSPQTSMYRQVLSYLEEVTRGEKVQPTSQLHFGEVAIATVALCIRWGSYFAVLTNRDLPQWAAAFDPQVSCMADGEMARINIEASAALSDWIDLMRADRRHFRKLVKAAVQLLPFPIAQLDGSTYYHRFRAFSAVNSVTGRRYLMEAFARDFGSEWLEREKARLIVNPTRALANGILNEHWRNGSGIEDVHAGGIAPPRPLGQRRLTRAPEGLVALYARVSSHEHRANLERQARRLEDHCAAKGNRVDKVVKEIGSGVNDHRAKFLALLEDQRITTIVVEHKDRATRFGFGYVEVLLHGQGRTLEVVNLAGNDREDLLHDLVSVIYSFAARLYGQRRAKRKTEAIVAHLKQEGSGETGRATSDPQG